METRSWFILAMIYLGLTALFGVISNESNNPWAYVIFLVFLMGFFCCTTVWLGNRSINKTEKKHKVKK